MNNLDKAFKINIFNPKKWIKELVQPPSFKPVTEYSLYSNYTFNILKTDVKYIFPTNTDEDNLYTVKVYDDMFCEQDLCTKEELFEFNKFDFLMLYLNSVLTYCFIHQPRDFVYWFNFRDKR